MRHTGSSNLKTTTGQPCRTASKDAHPTRSNPGAGVSLPQYAPPSDFALRWAMHQDTVWRLVTSGKVKGAKIGGARRINIQDALRYEREQSIEPVEPRRKRRRNACPVTRF